MTIGRLTKHFRRRWKRKVGAIPRLDSVNRMISEAQKITHQHRAYDGGMGGMEPFTVLAEYLYPKGGFIARVDEWSGVAVTVFRARMER